MSAFNPFLACTTPTCETKDGPTPSSSVICVENASARTCKVSLTRSQQDLIKPINLYRAAIIPDLWTRSAGEIWRFSNSIYPSLYRDLRVQVISLRPLKRCSWVVSVLKESSTCCNDEADRDSTSVSETSVSRRGTGH